MHLARCAQGRHLYRDDEITSLSGTLPLHTLGVGLFSVSCLPAFTWGALGKRKAIILVFSSFPICIKAWLTAGGEERSAEEEQEGSRMERGWKIIRGWTLEF